MITDPRILEKAIQKAIDGGWDTKGIDRTNFVVFIYDIQEFQLFAKALWGKGQTYKKKSGEIVTIDNPNFWKARLRNMVVAKDPIQYLGKSI